MEISVNVIKELIDSLNKSSIDVLRLDTQQFKLTLERTPAPVAPAIAAPAAVCGGAGQSAQSTAAPVTAASTNAAPETAAQQSAPCPAGTVLKSPIVGTFYSSAAPGKPPFVTVGKSVKKDDTLYIIESMKLMNEVTSECDGTIAEIMAHDGQAVEYGQPIMRLE